MYMPMTDAPGARVREVQLRADMAEVLVTTIKGLLTNPDPQRQHVVKDAAPMFEQLAMVQLGMETVGRAYLALPDGRRSVTVTLPVGQLVAMTRFIRSIAHRNAPLAYSSLLQAGCTTERLALLLMAAERFEAAVLADTIDMAEVRRTRSKLAPAPKRAPAEVP